MCKVSKHVLSIRRINHHQSVTESVKVCPLCLFLNLLFGHCVLTHTRHWASAHCDVAEY